MISNESDQSNQFNENFCQTEEIQIAADGQRSSKHSQTDYGCPKNFSPQNDWIIQTPLIDFDDPIDLNPKTLRQTFQFFLQSGIRLTQMTKIYDDAEALTKLLEEKERDMELAARIGQTLLDQNQKQSSQIYELELKLSKAEDIITQLKHDVSSKSDLLKFFIDSTEEESSETEIKDLFDDDDSTLTSIQSIASKDSSLILDDLGNRVRTLQEENARLRTETEAKTIELEDEERKETQLINECAKKLTRNENKINALKEDLAKRTEENRNLNDQIKKHQQQIISLEKSIRTLKDEKEELIGALNLAYESQTSLTNDLIEYQDKYSDLLAAFHTKQEECRKLQQQQSYGTVLSYVDSMAYELSNFSYLDEPVNSFNQNVRINAFSPDSLYSSNDSFGSSSSYQSTFVTNAFHTNQNTITKSLMPSSSNFDRSSKPETISSKSFSNRNQNSINLSKSFENKPDYLLSGKLRYLKPIEGSRILNRWRSLANPNLENLFTDKDRFISKIQANLAAIETKISSSNTNLCESQSKPTLARSSVYNNFVTTNSVYTYTTTSLFHMNDSLNEVSTTFSDVRLSTGTNECDQLSGQFSRKASLSSQQLNDRFSLIKQLKNIKVDTLNTKTSIVNSSASFDSKNNTSNSIKVVEGCPAVSITGGLNDLVRMFQFESNKPSTRIISRVQIAHPNSNGSLRPIATANEKKLRTNLSVLRNLRKGGFI
ncbi:Trafficking kinesin-binding protein 1 [Sarcoptes scabiei]|uniref:Trafficking kinesin-binding protein 1 n=1 Tax=Sarcoptes scabiei TaxID=52283 RepID=A0A834R9U9_SARSC|nr:Trafficking kinesin-binding protein 1 [Sarcoptes scabiei]